MDDKKRTKRPTIKELQKQTIELVEKVAERDALLLDARDEIEKLREIIHRYETMSAPVNASAEEKAWRPRLPMYRVITNGKRFAPQRSLSTEEGWSIITTWKKHSHGRSIVDAEFRTYREAVKFLRKQYGETADILPREWRAV